MKNVAIDGASAWTGRDLRPEEYRIELSTECREEIRRAASEISAFPLPTILRSAADFAMPACRAVMARVRNMLDHGRRFAIVDRLPIAEMDMDKERATAVYWLLSSMISRPVAQKLDGTMIYDVLDTGQQALPGSGIRPDKTNIEIRFHNDNAYNEAPPDYIGLLCLRQAQSGGHSRVISFHRVYNSLLARDRDRPQRLYRPFWFDRQREYRAGESPVFSAPVFEDAGELRARFSMHQINGGYALRGEPMDEEGGAAIAAMLEIFDEDGLSIDFDLEPGEMQFVHNRALGHSRTAFVDHSDPEHKRHLVRLWMRDQGRRAYPG
ncbi:MAG: TauD/TfdA family dioxygenase [Stellaceae bacterium]